MLRVIPALAGISAVLASGFVHGMWTERWGVAAEPAAWAAKLDRVPAEVGDWQSRGGKVNPKEPGGISGSLQSVYRNHRTGKEVTVYLVCGRPAPVSIHTPDVCYGAAGYEVLSPAPFALPAGAATPAEFQTALFRKKQAADQTLLRIFWSWSSNGEWMVPEKGPRRAFASCPALFKLYLIREMNSSDDPLETDPCVDLMKQLLPQLQQSLFGAENG